MPRLTALRHGKADKTFSEDHRVHPLSTEGKNMATARRLKLGDPKFNLILHSILPRTEETSTLIAGVDSQAPKIVVPGLFYTAADSRGLAIDKAFDKLGHVGIREYLKVVENELIEIATESASLIAEKLAGQTGDFDVLLVGHGVILPALGYVMTGEEEFLDVVYGECQGFRMNLNDKDNLESIEQILD